MEWLGFIVLVLIGIGVVVWLANKYHRDDKHDFDLDNPESVLVEGFSYSRFICHRCGMSLGLDLWQMQDLPQRMAYGCPGRPLTEEEQVVRKVAGIQRALDEVNGELQRMNEDDR